jgi:hypothetical protein
VDHFTALIADLSGANESISRFMADIVQKSIPGLYFLNVFVLF